MAPPPIELHIDETWAQHLGRSARAHHRPRTGQHCGQLLEGRLGGTLYGFNFPIFDKNVTPDNFERYCILGLCFDYPYSLWQQQEEARKEKGARKINSKHF